MLVKVKGVKDDVMRDWLYVGEVEGLEISDIIQSTGTNQNVFMGDDYLMFSGELFNKDHKYIRITCRRHDGHRVSIVFNTLAYICNDDGKTIEKHVVNEV